MRGMGMKSGQTNDAPRALLRIKPVAIGILAGMVACVLFLLLMSAVMTARHIPQTAVAPMALFALSAGAFVSGVVCAALARRAGLLHGAVCGLGMTAVVYAVGLFSGSGAWGVPFIFKAVFVLLAAMLGGVLSVNTGRGRSKIRK